MKIVYYNWVDQDDIEKRGGGVTVYQKNISSHDTNDEIFYISSGVYFDAFDRRPRIIQKRNKFFIQNSATLAPSHLSFSSKTQVSDAATVDIFIDALKRIVAPDVVHFNNFEGIPIDVLSAIKQHFPNIKIVYSVHNYYPFCPQVNLWNRERKSCDDYRNGKSCINCISASSDSEGIRKAYHLGGLLHKIGIKNNTKMFAFIWRAAVSANIFRNRIKRIIKPIEKEEKDFVNFSEKSEYFRTRRKKMVSAINEHCDIVLPVSERVREICLQYGIKPGLLRTCYIGTHHAAFFDPARRKNRAVRSIAYYGYMRRDKGFYFFLRCLKNVPDDIAKTLTIIIAAKNTDGRAYHYIKDLTERFERVIYADGYNAKSLTGLLAMTDLAVVPVLWEDNLPQVAIEANCHNVPLLCSDRGGASEITGRNPLYTFKAGSVLDFTMKLTDIVCAGVTEENYWNKTMSPISVDAHYLELRAIYASLQNKCDNLYSRSLERVSI